MQSIITYKAKHNFNLKDMLTKATQVANFALQFKDDKIPTSKDVKHIGLKSEISNQILRKYSQNKKLKKVNPNKVKLTIPGCGIHLDKSNNTINIRTLGKSKLNLWFNTKNIVKINQIEIDNTFVYISCSIKDQETITSDKFIGIDLNSTSSCIVTANTSTGKVFKYGKKIPHIQKKYKCIRKKLQQKKAFNEIKLINNRASRIVNDILHKVTSNIVKEAKLTNSSIKLENLSGISKKNTRKYKKESNFTLNSWPFYKFKSMILYKSKISGIEVFEINPMYTSQRCSKCLVLGNRERKHFTCPSCGHVDHSDVNAAFNIALSSEVNLPKNEIRKRGTKREDLGLLSDLTTLEGTNLESKLSLNTLI